MDWEGGKRESFSSPWRRTNSSSLRRGFYHNTLQRLAPVAHETRLDRLDPIITWHSPKPIYRRGNPTRRGEVAIQGAIRRLSVPEPGIGSSRVSAPLPRLLPVLVGPRGGLAPSRNDGDSGGGGGRVWIWKGRYGRWWWGAGGCAGVGRPRPLFCFVLFCFVLLFSLSRRVDLI